MNRILSALLPALLFLGCGQLELVGADDACPNEAGFSLEQAASCTEARVVQLGGVPEGASSLSPSFDGQTLRHVMALDYSGSMYGSYGGQDSTVSPACEQEAGETWYHWQSTGFASLLRQGVLVSMPEGSPAHPLVFNREVLALGPDNLEAVRFDFDAGRFEGALPDPIFGTEAVSRRLTASGAGTLPPNPYLAPFGSREMPGESRLGQVLDASAALLNQFEGRGVVWIVTDNIIEQTPTRADREFRDAENNREFYRRLKSDPTWRVVYAWPVHGQGWLCGGTLLVYGLYYDRHAELSRVDYESLTRGPQALLAHERQVQTFSEFGDASVAAGAPFKLKPDHLDVVSLRFVGKISCPSRDVGEARVCKAEVEVRNLLNHRRIDTVDIDLFNERLDPFAVTRAGHGYRLVPVRTGRSMCSRTLQVAESKLLIGTLAPQSSQRIQVEIWVPPVHTSHHTLADRWHSARFPSFGLAGNTRVEIRNLETSLAIPETRLDSVYGVESLPRIFRNPNTRDFDTEICLYLPVNNPSYLHSIFLLCLLAVSMIVLFGGSWLLAPSWRTVVADGREVGRIRLNRLNWTLVRLHAEPVAKARLSFGGQPRVKGFGSWKVLTRSGFFELRPGDEFQNSVRLVLASRSASSKQGKNDGF